VPRNYDPSLHPLEVPREYTRALNSTKLERVFAKPFIGNLDGHRDGVHTLCKHPLQLNILLSGACDGEVRVWNLAERKCLQTYNAHDGFVRGLCMNPTASMFFSCGNDKIIKHWKYDLETVTSLLEPVQTIVGRTFYTSIDHHMKKPMYATSGEKIDVWDETHLEPIKSYSWGVDSHYVVKFSPVEYHLMASCAADRSIILYDVRQSVPVRKVVMAMSSNSLCWNPLEAMLFTVASEDHNLYTFDMRKLDTPLQVHMDHTAAVMSVDYSPTGKEFVTASYDKTIRFFQANNGRSHEIYHTKRMQHVMAVKWSLDNKYVISGSDEMNIRIWKSHASEKLGLTRPREREQLEYGDKIKEKFKHFPEIKRIKRHRHLPKPIYNAQKEMRIQKASRQRKDANRRAHSKPGTIPYVSEKKKHVIEEQE
jgi:WD repeat and SOF domain-containing protein 1